MSRQNNKYMPLLEKNGQGFVPISKDLGLSNPQPAMQQPVMQPVAPQINPEELLAKDLEAWRARYPMRSRSSQIWQVMRGAQ